MFIWTQTKAYLAVILFCTYNFPTLAGNTLSCNPAFNLFYFAEHGNLINAFRIIKWQNMDIDERDNIGRTLLMYAAKQGDIHVIRQLIHQGANINARDGFGSNALIHATKNHKSNLPVFEYLLQQGTEDYINTSDFEKTTPLMHAVKHRHLHVVRLLIAKGADISARNVCGETALALAQKKNYPMLTALIIFGQFLQDFWPDKSVYQRALYASSSRQKIYLTMEAIEKINLQRTCNINHPIFKDRRCEKLEDKLIPNLYSYRLLPILKCCWDYLLEHRTQDAVLRIQHALARLKQQNWMSVDQYDACEEFFSLPSLAKLNTSRTSCK